MRNIEVSLEERIKVYRGSNSKDLYKKDGKREGHPLKGLRESKSLGDCRKNAWLTGSR